MTPIVLRPPFNRQLSLLGWLAVTIAVGLVAATQSPPILFFALVLAAILVCSVINPLAGLVALMILAPLRTLIATESAIQLPLDIGQMTLAVGLLAWAIYRIARGHHLLRLVRNPVTTIILFFLFIIGLTAFNATSLSAWLNEWLKWVQILVMIILVVDLAGDQRWQWLVFGLVLAGLANALIGLYEFLGGSGALHLLINDRFFRAFGTFGQPNPFGGFMGLLAPLALMAALGYSLRAWQEWRQFHHLRRSTWPPILFYTASSLFLIIGIFISWSRGSWLAFGMAIGMMALALPRQAWRGWLMVAIFASIIGVLWFSNLLPASIVARISSSTEELFAFQDVRGIDVSPENYAVAERLAHWQAALNMARAYPWLGVGVGNYEVVYPVYRLINWPEPLGHAHNYYLNILAEAGIIGLLAYGKVWIIIIWTTWRTRQHPDLLTRCIVIGLLGTWIYLSVHSLFDNLYVNNLFLHLGLMLGLLLVLYNQTWKNIGFKTP